MSYLDIVSGASDRWQQRTNIREPNRAKIDKGLAVETESPDRINSRIQHLTQIAEKNQNFSLGSKEKYEFYANKSSLLESLGFERLIGKTDFLSINFLELALSVARFVGRINIRSSPSRTKGYGTGFMVSPRLLMTNHHVFPTPEEATFSEIEFDYQNDRQGRLLPIVTFGFSPKEFFITSKELDYTLVAVKEESISGVKVRRYGWTRLIESQGKAILGESLNIIQHPKGEPKQLVLRSNQLVDLFDNYAHYVADTERGSSGAPVYNDQWELVALHHSGVPRKDINGNFLAKDGSVWKQGMNIESIDWVANEGIRISSLVDDIKRKNLENSLQEKMREDLLQMEPLHPLEAIQLDSENIETKKSVIIEKNKAQEMVKENNLLSGISKQKSHTWTIPLEVTISIGNTVANENIGENTIEENKISENYNDEIFDKEKNVCSLSSPILRRALIEAEAVSLRDYYNPTKDKFICDNYYEEIKKISNSNEIYAELHNLIKITHRKFLVYSPALELYPWVDLHDTKSQEKLQSIYSGKFFSAVEFIKSDFESDLKRSRLLELLGNKDDLNEESKKSFLEFMETRFPYNCEHVVPQSWFGKREPMRGDLHHLFSCESECNSFRSNVPYFDFEDFEEKIRSDCGKREEGKFEPFSGKGAIARATLYFLLRYPKEINRSAKEYTDERISTLLKWHKSYPVSIYEKHRNMAIYEKQGNRNPLIDFPEWVERINFLKGLG